MVRVIDKQARSLVVGDTIMGVGADGDTFRVIPAELGGVGPEGPEGPAGPAGATGPKGDTGAQGADGPDGPQGVAGPKGEQGAGLVPDGYGILDEAKVTAVETAGLSYVYVVDPDGDDRSNQTAPVGIAGDMSLHIIRYDADANAWRDFGQFTGVAGPKGDDGPQGPQGPRGLQGDPGPAGTNGADGAAGPTGSKGDQGLQGPKGDPGADGADGEDGTPGASGIGLDGVSVFRSEGVAAGGWYFDMKAIAAKTFTKVYAKQFAGTGDFDFELFINGVSVYAHADVAFGTPFTETGLNIELPLGAEAYVNITPSGSTVTGVWVQFEV